MNKQRNSYLPLALRKELLDNLAKKIDLNSQCVQKMQILVLPHVYRIMSTVKSPKLIVM